MQFFLYCHPFFFEIDASRFHYIRQTIQSSGTPEDLCFHSVRHVHFIMSFEGIRLEWSFGAPVTTFWITFPPINKLSQNTFSLSNMTCFNMAGSCPFFPLPCLGPGRNQRYVLLVVLVYSILCGFPGRASWGWTGIVPNSWGCKAPLPNDRTLWHITGWSYLLTSPGMILQAP